MPITLSGFLHLDQASQQGAYLEQYGHFSVLVTFGQIGSQAYDTVFGIYVATKASAINSLNIFFNDSISLSECVVEIDGGLIKTK